MKRSLPFGVRPAAGRTSPALEAADVLRELSLEEGRPVRRLRSRSPPTAHGGRGRSAPRRLVRRRARGYLESWPNWARTRTFGESATSSVFMRVEIRYDCCANSVDGDAAVARLGDLAVLAEDIDARA